MQKNNLVLKEQTRLQGQPADTLAQRHTFLAAWLGEMFDGMDASIFALVLFPAISELIHSRSYTLVGFYGSIILATFMVGYALGGVIFGALADRIGRTKTMIFSILIYALSTGLCALSNNWTDLAIYRFFVGLGIGGELSVGAVLVSESWHKSARLHAIGLLVASFPVGYILAALLNATLGVFSWRWLFIVGVLPAFVTLYIRARIKESDHFLLLCEYRKRLRQKVPNQLTEEEKEMLQPSLQALFGNSRLKTTLVCLAVSSSALVGYWIVLGWIPAWINQITGALAVQERSITAIVLNIGAIIACGLGGFFVKWIGRKACLLLSFTGALASSMALFLTVKSFGLPVLFYAFLIGAFASLPFAILLIYLPELYVTRIRSTAVGFIYNSGRIIAALGALLSGQLIAAFGGSYAKASACVAVCYLIGLYVSFFLPPSSGELKAESSL